MRLTQRTRRAGGCMFQTGQSCPPGGPAPVLPSLLRAEGLTCVASVASGQRACATTPVKLLFSPENAFTVGKEFGEEATISPIVGRGVCQVRGAQHTFVTITPSFPCFLFLPSPPLSLLPSHFLPFSLCLIH